MSLALYRKYRPQQFSAVIGQTYLVEIFQNAAKKNKLSHAYLLYGSRGTGKTTTARLIAKIANCENKDSLTKHGEPCGACGPCRQIDAGQALDVIEIDAASNRGIDEIRSLRDSIKLSPLSFRKKVFIIDETHMLTKDAFNALLKTLEEPPEHAILVLATTEYEKIPATISSRTQKFHFKKLTVREIVQKLEHICRQEKIKAAADALELIAAAAEGGLRDAESLLDQMTSVISPITVSSVEKIIGQIGLKKVIALADFVIKNDLKKSLEYLNELHRGGYNLTELNRELITYLRRVLALRFEANLENLFIEELTKDQVEQLKKHSQLIDPDQHINLLKSLLRAYSEMRYSPLTIVPLEVAIIENLQE